VRLDHLLSKECVSPTVQAFVLPVGATSQLITGYSAVSVNERIEPSGSPSLGSRLGPTSSVPLSGSGSDRSIPNDVRHCDPSGSHPPFGMFEAPASHVAL
jgi:hypothetical protein